MNLDASTQHLLNLAIIAPLAVAAWRSAARLGPGSIIMRALLLYLVLAHLGKAALLTFVAWGPAVDTGLVSRSLTEAEDMQVARLILFYTAAALAACATVTGLLRAGGPVAHGTGESREKAARLLRMVLWLLLVLLPYKFFINHIMRWGVPAHKPEHTIPLITGGSVYLVRDAMMCLCATALYQSFVVLQKDPRARLLRRLAVLASLCYVAIDLAMGSKFGMLGLVFVSMSLATRAFLRQDARGRTRTIVLALLVTAFVIPAYQLANILRFISLDHGFDLIALYSKFSDKINIDLMKMVFTMLGRATGAEGVAAAVILDGHVSPHLRDIFLSSDFADQYTFALTGLDADNVAFGATLAGTYSLVCRADLACEAGIAYIVTFLLMGALALVVTRLPCRPGVRYGIAASLALVAVHSQLASGGIQAFGQRILVIIAAGLCLELMGWLRDNWAPAPAMASP